MLGDIHRRPSAAIQRVDVRPVFQQQRGNLFAPVSCRIMQSGFPVLVRGGVDLDLVGHQHANNLDVSTVRRKVQCAIAPAVCLVHVAAVLDVAHDRIRITIGRRVKNVLLGAQLQPRQAALGPEQRRDVLIFAGEIQWRLPTTLRIHVGALF